MNYQSQFTNLDTAELDQTENGLVSNNLAIKTPLEYRDLDRALVDAKQSMRVWIGHQTYFDVGIRDEKVAPNVQLRFIDKPSLEKSLVKPRLINLANAFFDGKLDVLGSMLDAVEVLHSINLAFDRRSTLGEWIKNITFRASKILWRSKLTQFESLDHYSNSAEAYKLFLDKHMQYTCGLFTEDGESLEEAQENKFDLIVELAGVQNGFSHLDIGCGWGGLIGYFQTKYGSNSVGLTNTPKQALYAKEKFSAEAIVSDFEIADLAGQKFDLITIVGMIEHLTPFRQRKLLEIAAGCLSENGKLYIQCVSKPENFMGGDAYRIVQRDVFPGHHLMRPEEHKTVFQNAGLEFYREPFEHSSHYAQTTKIWAENVEKNAQQMAKLIGVRNMRVYLAYLAYSSKMFADNRGLLMRYVLQKTKSKAFLG